MTGITQESINVMKNSLTKFNMTQTEMINALKRVYDGLSDECNDPKFRELGEALDNVYTILNNSSVEVTNLITKLQVIEGYLIEIAGIKLN